MTRLVTLETQVCSMQCLNWGTWYVLHYIDYVTHKALFNILRFIVITLMRCDYATSCLNQQGKKTAQVREHQTIGHCWMHQWFEYVLTSKWHVVAFLKRTMEQLCFTKYSLSKIKRCFLQCCNVRTNHFWQLQYLKENTTHFVTGLYHWVKHLRTLHRLIVCIRFMGGFHERKKTNKQTMNDLSNS